MPARTLNLDGITPTQDLILDVLLARHRLGETLWTFHSRHKAAIEDLGARGAVTPMHGIEYKTVRAILSDAAIHHFLSTAGGHVPAVAKLHTRDVRLNECRECRRPWPCRTREMTDPALTLTEADRT